MNEIRKSLVVTGIVILSMVAVVGALLRTARGRSGAHAQPPTEQVDRTAAPGKAGAAPSDRPAASATAAQRRAGFASRMERRLRGQGKGITVQATGVESTVLEFNWTVRADRVQMENLKRARPLVDELKSLGFSSLVMKVRERKVWSQEL